MGHSFSSEAEGPIDVFIGGKKSSLLENTVFASKIFENILSVGEAVDRGFTMLFNKKGVFMYRDYVLQGKRSRKNNLFYFELSTKPQRNDAATLPRNLAVANIATSSITPMKFVPVMNYVKIREIQVSRSESEAKVCERKDAVVNMSRTYYEHTKDFDLWHPRMVHINPRLALLAKPDLKEWPKKCFCASCTQGKFHRHSHSGTRPKQADIVWAPGEYWSCDLFGPLLKSKGGARYVAFYIDMKSRFIYAKPLQEKTDNYLAMVEVINDARARSGRPMRFFKSDGDGIFTGKEAQAIFSKYAIRHIQSARRFGEQRHRGAHYQNYGRIDNNKYFTCRRSAKFMGGGYVHGSVCVE